MVMLREFQGPRETCSEGRWVKLHKDVTSIASGSSDKKLPFPSSLLDDIHEGLVLGGLRPRCSILRALIDAMAFQLACLEQERAVGPAEDKAPSGSGKPPDPDSRCSSSGRTTAWKAKSPFTPLEDLDVTSMPMRPPISVTPTSMKKGKKSKETDTTDDEEDIFSSPRLFPYKKVLPSKNSRVTPMQGKADLKDLAEDAQSPTPEKHVFMGQHLQSESKRSEKIVRRQLNLDFDPPTAQKQGNTSAEVDEVIILPESSILDNTSFLETSTITLDATPPPPPNRLPVRKQKPISSLDSTFQKPSGSSSLFGIAAKKKAVWVDHDLHAQPAHTSTSNSFNKRPSSQTKGKLYKQQSLLAMARNIPKKKVDITTFKEFNGGSRTQSQTSISDEGAQSRNGVKRKSDESVESTPAGKRDKSYYSDTSFEISPIKLPPPRPISASSPVAGPSRKAASSPKKPLSPVDPRVSNRINNARVDKEPKPGGSKKEEFESTYDLLKDYDKIPSRKSPQSKFKYKEPTVRKKADRAKLPGWDCDQCRGYYGLLESQMDEQEIARIRDRCSRHRSKAPVISNTPENFWCTQIRSTEELYREGYIQVCTPFTPPPRRKRRSSDDEDEGSENRDAL